jgi:hypothetical protein
VGAGAFHDAFVVSPVLRVVSHVVVGAVVDGAGPSGALGGVVDVVEGCVAVF